MERIKTFLAESNKFLKNRHETGIKENKLLHRSEFLIFFVILRRLHEVTAKTT